MKIKSVQEWVRNFTFQNTKESPPDDMQHVGIKKWQYGGIAGHLTQTAMPTSCHLFCPGRAASGSRREQIKKID